MILLLCKLPVCHTLGHRSDEIRRSVHAYGLNARILGDAWRMRPRALPGLPLAAFMLPCSASAQQYYVNVGTYTAEPSWVISKINRQAGHLNPLQPQIAAGRNRSGQGRELR